MENRESAIMKDIRDDEAANVGTHEPNPSKLNEFLFISPKIIPACQESFEPCSWPMQSF